MYVYIYIYIYIYICICMHIVIDKQSPALSLSQSHEDLDLSPASCRGPRVRSASLLRSCVRLPDSGQDLISKGLRLPPNKPYPENQTLRELRRNHPSRESGCTMCVYIYIYRERECVYIYIYIYIYTYIHIHTYYT